MLCHIFTRLKLKMSDVSLVKIFVNILVQTILHWSKNIYIKRREKDAWTERNMKETIAEISSTCRQIDISLLYYANNLWALLMEASV